MEATNAWSMRPQAYARTGGILYLFIIVAALFGELFVRGRLVVRGDPAATAANILGAETLYRVGLAGELLTCVADIALAMILYVLLRPVNRPIALLAAFYRVAFVGVYMVAKLFQFAVVFVLAGERAGAPTAEAQSLAYLFLRLHGHGYDVSLVLFGCTCIFFGYLAYRSGYLPAWIGALLAIGGVGYVVNSFAQVLAPGSGLFPWIILPAFFGELALALWLTVKGIDRHGWVLATEVR